MQHKREELHDEFARYRMPWLIAGVAGIAATAYGYFTGSPDTKDLFWEVYLMAFLMCLGMSLGGLGFLLISHIVTGRWFHFIQRPLEAAAKTLWLCAILFVGVWLGRHHLYGEWIDRAKDGLPQRLVAIGHHPVESFNVLKHAYMTHIGWIGRSVACFAIWIFMTRLLTKWSKRQDDSADGEPWGRKMRVLSGIGIVVFGLSGTVMAFDLLVALHAIWYSSIYGIMTLVSFGLTTLALMALVTYRMREYEPYRVLMTNRQSHDIGTMMFAFTILWTYMQAGQLIIIWNANLAEETCFYLKRIEGNWLLVDWLLAIFAFALPFLLLLSQPLKRNRRTLAIVGLFVFLMRYLDWYWEVCPWFRDAGFHWLMIAMPVGMIGLWLAAFFHHLSTNALPASKDPRYQRLIYQVLGHHGGGH